MFCFGPYWKSASYWICYPGKIKVSYHILLKMVSEWIKALHQVMLKYLHSYGFLMRICNETSTMPKGTGIGLSQ